MTICRAVDFEKHTCWLGDRHCAPCAPLRAEYEASIIREPESEAEAIGECLELIRSMVISSREGGTNPYSNRRSEFLVGWLRARDKP